MRNREMSKASEIDSFLRQINGVEVVYWITIEYMKLASSPQRGDERRPTDTCVVER